MVDADPAGGRRAQKKDAARNLMTDAVIDLLGEGRLDINHDLIAERTGIARRTVYRYFPDRQALLAAANARVRELAGPRVAFPECEADLLDTVDEIYTGFDRIASIVTLMRSTPQGRAMRLSQNDERVASYRAATRELVKALPERDRDLATAMIQVIHTTIWLEMRDHWGLAGDEIARAARWALTALMHDLRDRGGKSLDDTGRLEPAD